MQGANEQSSSSEPPKTSLVMGLGDAIDSSSSGSDQDEDDEGGFEVEYLPNTKPNPNPNLNPTVTPTLT